MTTSASRPTAPAGPIARPRPVRPVLWFAALGAGFLAIGGYEWLASYLAGDLKPTTAGRGTGPSWVLWSVHGQEVLLGAVGLVVLYLFVYRPWKRDGQLSLDGMMVLSWATLWAIQDPWVSYSQTVISYNSSAINLGCPQCHLPGWLSNNTLAEPIIWGLGCYLGPMFLFTLAANRVMAAARTRWPSIGRLGLVMVAVGFMAVSDVVLEVLWTWTSVYSYGGADPALSLFGQSYVKYPLWVGLFWGIAWGLIASIRFFTNDRGETVVERGVRDLRVGPRRMQLVRLLALIGAMNGLFAFAYNVPVQWFSLHAHAFPQDLLNRPYLLGGVCGPGTEYACPDSRIPIPRGPDSGRVRPDGTFVAPNGLPVQTAREQTRGR
jgi:hypothetical protein